MFLSKFLSRHLICFKTKYSIERKTLIKLKPSSSFNLNSLDLTFFMTLWLHVFYVSNNSWICPLILLMSVCFLSTNKSLDLSSYMILISICFLVPINPWISRFFDLNAFMFSMNLIIFGSALLHDLYVYMFLKYL